MATTFEWTVPEAIQTYFSTGLNSLADGSFVGVGSAITNETGSPALYQYMDLELNLASLSPATGAYVDIWLLPTLDATNYGTTGKPLITAHLLCTFQLDTTASTAQRIIKTNVCIPALDFKLDLRNKAGVAFNASGNTLKYRRHYEQGV